MRLIVILCFVLGISSCKVYNQNIMFKTKENIISSRTLIEGAVNVAEKNYLIQKNDYIEVRVFTNKGEIIISPPIPGKKSQGLNQNSQFLNNQQQGLGQVQGNQFPLQFPSFLVQQNGYAKLPLINTVRLEGLTLNQADSVLEKKYLEFYEEPFVRTRYSNKRVIVFKGGTGTIFPLRNEKMSLVEVLAQTGGVNNDLRASNIRLVRGNLEDPDVYVINLRTMEGVMSQSLTVEPNDIIYVEPVRKTVLEALKDVSPILSFVSTILTFTLLLR